MLGKDAKLAVGPILRNADRLEVFKSGSTGNSGAGEMALQVVQAIGVILDLPAPRGTLSTVPTYPNNVPIWPAATPTPPPGVAPAPAAQ